MHEEHRRHGIFFHVHDIKVVERTKLNVKAHWGSEQQQELRYLVTYHTYVAGLGGQHRVSVSSKEYLTVSLNSLTLSPVVPKAVERYAFNASQ